MSQVPTTTTAPTQTGFWLTDAINAMGSWGTAYLNNQLAYEHREQEIELYKLQMQAYQQQAQQTAATQGVLPAQIGGLPSGLVILMGLLLVGGVIWAAKN
jgi:hypothetical protein